MRMGIEMERVAVLNVWRREISSRVVDIGTWVRGAEQLEARLKTPCQMIAGDDM